MQRRSPVVAPLAKVLALARLSQPNRETTVKKKLNINRKVLLTFAPYVIIAALAIGAILRFANPAPAKRIIISTGDDEGDYKTYANQYKDIIKEDGVELVIRSSSGAKENLKLLEDPKSDIDVAFVQDGMNTEDHENNLMSLGSLYYEPLWIFYRGKTPLTRFSQLLGKRVAVGEHGGGTPTLAWRLLKANGIDKKNTTILHADYAEAADALIKNQADAAFFIATPEDPLIHKMFEEGLNAMNVDQAEAIVRQMPYLHHLVLPHGAIDLKNNVPDHDIDLISPTATLVAKDTFPPALVDLILKAASEVHSEPGIFEKKGEFPIDKDYDYPLSDEAKRFYKNGTPFWQRYLPFWLATLVDRFILVVFPLLALIIPAVKSVPKYLEWRVRNRIYQRYGELKYLETQMKGETTHHLYSDHLKALDTIEDKVNHMKVPLEFSEHVYVLREHIEFVRGRLTRGLPPEDKREAIA
jgi:TRAP transporter TAXI family solute receptor